MKRLKSKHNTNTQDIVGKITLNGKNIFNRSSYILVTNNKPIEIGYKAIITTQSVSAKAQTPYIHIDKISDFIENDVVKITSSGEIYFLYERNSTSNVIFTTAKCNHKCMMCPQPPVVQEKDLTNFNIELIKLFHKETKNIGITGGEPTMIGEKLFELIHQIKKSCPKASVNILSNGVKFSDIDYTAKLAACNHPDLQIDIPIFSDVANEHNHIVGAKTFYKTIQGLYNLAQFSQQIGLRIVIHKQTYKRLPQLAEYIYRNFPFVTQVAFMQMETTGLAEKNLNELWIDPFNYNEELQEAIEHLTNRGITAYIYNAQLCVLPPTLRFFAQRTISEWKEVYLPECNACTLKNECGGLFESNLKTHSKHIRPLH